ncbi:MAG: hypothetical protein RML40_05005 [Bacteroidota bacterium]|nr:hypothetical protein [Candidatus Kapabacteria bacterium]MDW8219871.1 hypothetical protein [Bacteroidota bacterium]
MQHTSQQSSPASHAPSIVLVSDDSRLLKKARRLLEKSPLSLLITSEPSGLVEQLLRLLASRRVYVMIDLDAHSFDGIELARVIRESLSRSDKVGSVQILACTINPNPALMQKARLSGIDVVLQRFALERLLRTIAEEIQ